MDGAILSTRVNEIEYIRFVGVIRYSQCAGLESHIERLFNQPTFSKIAIDLEPAEMLDSTALGLLARISIEFRKISNEKPVIFLQNGELAHILRRVCFDQVFNIIANPQNNQRMDFVELASISKNEEEVLKSILQAHQNLASVSESNEHYFTDITQALI